MGFEQRYSRGVWYVYGKRKEGFGVQLFVVHLSNMSISREKVFRWERDLHHGAMIKCN